jgi:hypothetical protein
MSEERNSLQEELAWSNRQPDSMDKNEKQSRSPVVVNHQTSALAESTVGYNDRIKGF